MNSLQLLKKAQNVLEKNILTNPSQSSWQTGISALGLIKIDWEKAAASLLHIFNNQKENGFLPYIDNSQLTQPPLWAMVSWQVFEQAEDKAKGLDFLRQIFPKIIQLHRYLYAFRDPKEEGLCSIIHPIESVFEDSPNWKELSKEMPNGYLEEILIKQDGDKNSISEGYPFQVQCPFFNTILAWSNESLIRIGEVLGEDVTEIVQWYELTIHTFNEKLWDEEYSIYNAYDLVNNKLIALEGISGLLPLAGGIPDIGQALHILDLLQSEAFSGGFNQPQYLCPSYSLECANMILEKKSWGAINMDLNWLLYQGLKKYETPEFLTTAEQVKKDSLSLVAQNGFRDYYSPNKNEVNNGFGTSGNVITAATVLDWLL